MVENMATDTINDSLVINYDGTYAVSFNLSIRSDSNSWTATTAIHKNGMPIPGTINDQFINNGSEVGSISATGIVTLQPGDIIDLRAIADSGFPTYKVTNGSLKAYRIN